jgi:glycosyltransferase involved in cell wall biosynthesis
LRGVNQVIAASHLELADSVGDSAKGTVISHPVVDQCSTGRPRAQSASGAFTLGYLGRLHPKKNVPNLIRSLACLPGSVRLLICGAGSPSYQAELTDIALTAGVADRVEWRGFVDAVGKTRLFSDVSVVVMPSAYEGFGMVAAEAMAVGVPVVVSRSTGIAPIVEQYGAGVVVSSGIEAELTNAVRSLMYLPGRLESASLGAAQAARHALSFDAYAEAVTEVYSRAIRPSGIV